MTNTSQGPRIQLGDPEPRIRRHRGLKLPKQRVPVDEQLLLERENEQLARRKRQDRPIIRDRRS